MTLALVSPTPLSSQLWQCNWKRNSISSFINSWYKRERENGFYYLFHLKENVLNDFSEEKRKGKLRSRRTGRRSKWIRRRIKNQFDAQRELSNGLLLSSIKLKIGFDVRLHTHTHTLKHKDCCERKKRAHTEKSWVMLKMDIRVSLRFNECANKINARSELLESSVEI